MDKALLDNFGRKIDYFRISVTDRCNFRCFYCIPDKKVKFMPHQDMLQYEEILQIANVFIELGIKKIRITGGEPLIRRNILFLIKKLGSDPRIDELTLTTNGCRLSEYADTLKESGINRINVSLDSLNRETFKRITGFDKLKEVIAGIKSAGDTGLKIKINIVAMKGFNDGEILNFLEFGITNDIDIRFVEIMPQCYNNSYVSSLFISGKDILRKIKQEYAVQHIGFLNVGSTEELYAVRNTNIRIGLINPISQYFCGRCNRIRLRPDGALQTCLFGKRGINLKTLLQENKSIGEIKQAIVDEIMKKPPKHFFDSEKSNLIMHKVGG